MKFSSVWFFTLLLLFAGVSGAAAQGAGGDPLVGTWDVTDSQTGTGTAVVTITKDDAGILRYTSSSGDEGTLERWGLEGYRFQSSKGGGSGIVTPNGDGTWAWQNLSTGAGGTMTPHA